MPPKSKEALAHKADYQRAYQIDNAAKLKTYRRSWQRARLSTPEGRVAQLVRSAKRRAKASGKEFDLVPEDLSPLPSRCPLLGIELDYGIKENKAAPNSPSLDRIDSSKGYVRGNVWIVSWRANLLKNDGTWQELESIAKAMKEKLHAGC